MKLREYVLTYKLEIIEGLREQYQTIMFINIDDLQAVGYFRYQDIVCLIIDLDNSKKNEISSLEKFAREHLITIIYVSSVHKRLAKYDNGEVVFKNSKLIGERVLDTFNEKVFFKDATYVFDYITRSVYINGIEYQLQNAPFMILRYLVMNKNRPCTRAELLESTGANLDYTKERTVDVHMNSIRNKLKDKRIKTVLGEGYIFDDMK